MSTTAPKSKVGLIIIIVVAILIVGVVLYIYRDKLFGVNCDPNRNGFDKKGNPNPKCQFNDPKSNNEPSPSGSGGWISDANFPIKKGSWGPKVAALQKAIGVAQDGKFGPKTEAALKAKTGKTQVDTQAEYDSIISAEPSDKGGDNYKLLKAALGSTAIPFSAGVYVNASGQNQNYVFSFWPDGQFFFSLPKVQTSIVQGKYFDGGKRMKLDGDIFAYTEGSVSSNMKRITKEYGE